MKKEESQPSFQLDEKNLENVHGMQYTMAMLVEERRRLATKTPDPQNKTDQSPSHTRKDTLFILNDIQVEDDVSVYKSKTKENFFYQGKSFYMKADHPFRSLIIQLVDSSYFEKFILLLIVSNCIILAIDNPLSSTNNNILEEVQNAYTILFTFEMIFKIIAMGFFYNGPFSYARDYWNILDFVVVLLGYISFFPMIDSNISALRSIRVLRPLRTISSNPGMRILVNSLINSLPELLDVFILFTFLFFIFGIFGMQLYKGLLRQQCFDISTGILIPDSSICSTIIGYGYNCPLNQFCADAGFNPNSGTTGFDNILQSWLTIFQSVTLEGWCDIMYALMDAGSQTAVIFFILLILFGSLFAINLVVAVIYSSYIKGKELVKNEEKTKSDNSTYLNSCNSCKDKLDCHCTYCECISTTFSKLFFEEIPSSEKIQYSEKNWFSWMVICTILFNCILLASEHSSQPDYWTNTLEVFNILFTIFFACEMFIKLTVLGFKVYTSDNFNIFDALIVIFGIIEIILIYSVSTTTINLSPFRTFRLLRVFKLVKSWKTLNILILTIFNSMTQLVDFTFILILIMFIYTLLGMQLFGGKMSEFRANFDSFGWSFVTVFQLLGGENWNDVMVNSVGLFGYASVIFFISLFILGNYLLLNLFLAILLSNMDEIHSIPEKKNYSDSYLQFYKPLYDFFYGPTDESLIKSNTILDSTKGISESIIDETKEIELVSINKEEKEIKSQHSDLQIPEKPRPHLKISKCDICCSYLCGKEYFEDSETTTEFEEILTDFSPRSLFCLYRNNPFRIFFIKIVISKYFDYFIFFVIFISSLFLALETPNIDENSSYGQALSYVNNICSYIFIAEAVSKIIAMGFYFDRKGRAYLQNGWNILDFIVILFSMANYLNSSGSLNFVKAFRSLRALRPLRMIRRLSSTKAVVETLISALPKVLNVLVVFILFYFIFGIMGIQFFQGLLQRCLDSSGEIIYVNMTICPYTGGQWKNPEIGNFDNIGNSVLSLFEASTMEMWPDFMYTVVDHTEYGQPPMRDASQNSSIFFVLFLVVSNFFLMNLFVGVVADSFYQTRQEQKFQGILLTEKQKEWLMLFDLFDRISSVGEQKLNPPVFCAFVRKIFFDIISHKWFEPFIMTCICLNILIMSTYYYNPSPGYQFYLDFFNYLFTFLFLFEAIFKLVGLGFKQYFGSPWNLFDFVIVVGSLISFFLDIFETKTPFDITLLRFFRILRILRLINRAKTLKRQIHTLVKSSKSIVNVGILLLLLFFVYSVMGMTLFSGIPYGDFLNKHVNFDSLGISMLLLFRCATGESWNGIMHECIQQKNCDSSTQYCGTWLAVPYFISFFIFCVFVLLNLFVAIILQYFSEEETGAIGVISLEDLKEFTDQWIFHCKPIPWWQFWREKTQPLPWRTFIYLLEHFHGPIGLADIELSVAEKIKFFSSLNISIQRHDLYNQGGFWMGETYEISYVRAITALAHACHSGKGAASFLKRSTKQLTDIISQLGKKDEPDTKTPHQRKGTVVVEIETDPDKLVDSFRSASPGMRTYANSKYLKEQSHMMEVKRLSITEQIINKEIDLAVLYATVQMQAIIRGSMTRRHILNSLINGDFFQNDKN